MGPWSFEIAETEEEQRLFAAEFLELHRHQCRLRGMGCPFADEKWVGRLNIMVKHLSPVGMVICSRLRSGTRVLASRISFRSAALVSLWGTAFDPEAAEVSPGNLQMLFLIERLFQRDVEAVDLGTGESGQKDWIHADVAHDMVLLFAFRSGGAALEFALFRVLTGLAMGRGRVAKCLRSIRRTLPYEGIPVRE